MCSATWAMWSAAEGPSGAAAACSTSPAWRSPGVILVLSCLVLDRNRAQKA